MGENRAPEFQEPGCPYGNSISKEAKGVNQLSSLVKLPCHSRNHRDTPFVRAATDIHQPGTEMVLPDGSSPNPTPALWLLFIMELVA